MIIKKKDCLKVIALLVVSVATIHQVSIASRQQSIGNEDGYPSPEPLKGAWKLVFDEDFTTPFLDHEKWATRYIYKNETLDTLNKENQIYRNNSNHVVRDGSLHLVARRIPDEKIDDPRFRYESGLIRSHQTFYFGYFEARVKFPWAKGVFPAFWLNPAHDAQGLLSWPPEIDIFEFVNNGREDTPFMIHSGVIQHDKSKGQFIYRNPQFNARWGFYRTGVNFAEGWHTVGGFWTPDTMTVYVDGVRLYTKQYSWANADGDLAAPASVILNLAIGGDWAGRHGIADEHFPQSLEVDYVRVYQFDKKNTKDELIEKVPYARYFTYETEMHDLERPELHQAKLNNHLFKPDENISTKILIKGKLPQLPEEPKLVWRLRNNSGTVVHQRQVALNKAENEVIDQDIAISPEQTLQSGVYDLDLAISYQHDSKLTNIPMAAQHGVLRQKGLWYTVGKFLITEN